MHVCVSERERERARASERTERAHECLDVCVCERECMYVRERVHLCVCVRERMYIEQTHERENVHRDERERMYMEQTHACVSRQMLACKHLCAFYHRSNECHVEVCPLSLTHTHTLSLSLSYQIKGMLGFVIDSMSFSAQLKLN